MARAAADDRKLERTSVPGVFRRHASGCSNTKRCKCPYVVTWRDRGKQHKQLFATFELAREHKNALGSGKVTRRPLSSQTVADYYERWLPSFRGRTSRGLDESTRKEYEASFKRLILPLPIAGVKMRDLAAPDVRDWLAQVERQGASPYVIRNAKSALSVMLACAAEDGEIAGNPAALVRYVPSEAAKRRHPKRKRRVLTPDDVQAILGVMDERWQAFFLLLTQTGLRVGEMLGLTWERVHLGDDPHIMVVEQVRHGRRKKLKTEASRARVPLAPSMASWLAQLRPHDAAPDDPVFPSKTGTPLNSANVRNRVLQPALVKAGIAVKVGEKANGDPVYDYQGVAFHAFRRACGSFLLHEGKTLKQVQGWLRHSQLTTTLNIYVEQVDDGLGGAEVWDDILPARGNAGATRPPEAAANGAPAGTLETAS
jgi:integrase